METSLYEITRGPDDQIGCKCILHRRTKQLSNTIIFVPPKLASHWRQIIPLVPEVKPYTESVEITEEKGKGQGLRLLKDVKKGELVLAERAISITGEVEGTGGTMVLQKEVVDWLNPDRRAQIDSMHGSTHVEKLRLNVIGEDIMLLNGDTFEEHQIAYLGHLISRINHSCGSAANLTVQFNTFNFMIEAFAKRDLECGAFLSFAYYSGSDSKKRRETIKQQWGFTCTCTVCASE